MLEPFAWPCLADNQQSPKAEGNERYFTCSIYLIRVRPAIPVEFGDVYMRRSHLNTGSTVL